VKEKPKLKGNGNNLKVLGRGERGRQAVIHAGKAIMVGRTATICRVHNDMRDTMVY
jgi:hypothetical protein